MSRDYRLRVSSPYFLYLYVQKYNGVASVGPPVAVGRVPCTLCTPYCYATESSFKLDWVTENGPIDVHLWSMLEDVVDWTV